MDWTHHLFRFGGRIGRVGFWSGLFALFCTMIALLALGALLGRLSDGWDQQSALEFVPHSASPSPGMHVKRSE